MQEDLPQITAEGNGGGPQADHGEYCRVEILDNLKHLIILSYSEV